MPKRNKAGGLDRSAYEQLVQSVVDYAIFMLDPEGHVASWNPGAERIKGYTADEIIGEHFSRFYTPEDRDAGLPEHVLKQAAVEGRFVAEGWRVRKDGSHFWAAVVVDPIRQGDKLVGFAKVTRDMTESREANLAALESERRFRLLVQGVIDYAIYMLDPQGRITNWNTGAQHIKGYTADEIIGEHFSRFYTPEDVGARVPWTALETAEREGRFTAEGWRQRKDGTRFCMPDLPEFFVGFQALLLRDGGQKLLACSRVLAKGAQHAARHHRDPVLANAAGRHTGVGGLNDNRHSAGPEHLVDRVGDLGREPLLDLQPPCIGVDDARELRDTHNTASRQVADVHGALNGCHVVLTAGLERNIA